MVKSYAFILFVTLCIQVPILVISQSTNNTITSAPTSAPTTYTVTASFGKYYINGTQQASLSLTAGNTYVFDLSSSTVNNHPFVLSTTADGTHGGGSIYTTGVTTTPSYSSAFSSTQFRSLTFIPAASGSFYYFCAIHPGMGGGIAVTGGTPTPASTSVPTAPSSYPTAVPSSYPTAAPTIVCFGCTTRVMLHDGTYKSIDEIRSGDALFAFDRPHVVVKTVTKRRVLNHQQVEVMTIQPHACGINQPFRSVDITRHHAIRCPRMMSELNIPEEERDHMHMYPFHLPSSYISYSTSKYDYVCNVDIGDPEMPLVVEGMLTESWDGFDAGEIRHHTWQFYNNTIMMKRMRSLKIQL